MYTVEIKLKDSWVALRDYKDRDRAIWTARFLSRNVNTYRVVDSFGMVVFQSKK